MVEKLLTKESEDRKYWILRNAFRISRRTKPPYPPVVGSKIGSWKILGAWTSQKGFLLAYKCQCTCGHVEEYMDASNLKKGNTQQCKSCGVKNSESSIIDWASVVYPEDFDDKKKDRIKFLLNGMIARCEQDHHKENNIKVDETWITLPESFIVHIITLEGWEDNSLIPDRINTRGNYEPHNVRFISLVENTRNRTDTVYLMYKDEEVDIMTFIQREFGVERAKHNRKLYNAVYALIKRGQPANNIIKYVKMKKLLN